MIYSFSFPFAKELLEKLGRNDLCPCGSGRRFQEMLYAQWPLRR
ncbi:MAG TPA: SEC-C metal-binding domain-containing protein [Candidatus Angelobacter sp.]|nr:SEC-C metal-binding domain-containing protein [Candidatus Angelobacter sp.]